MQRRILVAGRSGQLARSLAALRPADFEFVTVGRPDLDLADPAGIGAAIGRLDPFAVVNAAAYTAVDKAETDEAAAFAINCEGAGALAAAAAVHGVPIVHISTDYVFSGSKGSPYEESDRPDPQGAYGRSKLAGERAVAAANPAHVILRTAWVYSPYGHNFLKTMMRLAGERDVVRVVDDQIGAPTYAPDIAAGICAVLARIAQRPDDEDWRGVFHMTARGETSWAGFAEAIFDACRSAGLPAARVERISTADYPTPARRPADSRLGTGRFSRQFAHELPDWRAGIGPCVGMLKHEFLETGQENKA